MKNPYNTTAGKIIPALLTPSWLSGFCCVLISMVVVVGFIALSNYKGSDLQQLFSDWQSSIGNNLNMQTYNGLAQNPDLQNAANTAFTFVMWGFVGLLVYLIVYGVYDILHNAEEFEEELHYVHANRKQMVHDAAWMFAIRFFVLAGWLAYSLEFLRFILPHVLVAAYVAAGQGLAVKGFGFALAAFVALAVALHIHVVLLRLLLLRPRVFHSEVYL